MAEAKKENKQEIDHATNHKDGDEAVPDDVGRCPEGQVVDPDNEKRCKAIDMETKAFGFGDSIDPFLEDVADTTEDTDVIQEAVNESSGVNPIALEFACGIFLLLLMCIVVPIYCMMTKRVTYIKSDQP